VLHILITCIVTVKCKIKLYRKLLSKEHRVKEKGIKKWSTLWYLYWL